MKTKNIQFESTICDSVRLVDPKMEENKRRPHHTIAGEYLHSGEDVCFFIFVHYLCIAIYFRLFLLFYHKRVMPMEITFMDMEDKYKKYGSLRSLRYIYSHPFKFPISSLGLPNIPSYEGWEGALAKYPAGIWTLTRQILESYLTIVNLFFTLKPFASFFYTSTFAYILTPDLLSY